MCTSGTFISPVTGERVIFFQCGPRGDDWDWGLPYGEAMAELDRVEQLRNAAPLYDPNRRIGRRVRSRVQHLGMAVNQLEDRRA